MNNPSEYWDKQYENRIVDDHRIFTNKPKRKLIGAFLRNEEIDQMTKLEVGCGLGGLADYMHWKNDNYLGIDISPTAIEFVKKQHINAQCVDIFDFEEHAFERKKFDCILFLDSFEHILYLDKLAFKCRDLLNENGRIYINIPMDSSNHDGDYDYYVREDNIKRFTSLVGIEGYDKWEIKIPEQELSFEMYRCMNEKTSPYNYANLAQ